MVLDNLTFYVVAMVIIEIFADFQLRFYAVSDKFIHLGAGLLGYAGVLYYFIQALRLENVLYVNAYWDGFSHILESVAAYVLLGDRLGNTGQWVGFILVMVGTYMMRYYRLTQSP
jgi:multidrug transporter EmrE-like cation transporter